MPAFGVTARSSGAPMPHCTGMAFTAASGALLDERTAGTAVAVLSGGREKLIFHFKNRWV